MVDTPRLQSLLAYLLLHRDVRHSRSLLAGLDRSLGAPICTTCCITCAALCQRLSNAYSQ